MKKSIAIGLLTAAEARKHLMKSNGQRVRSPKVLGNCEPACIFEDDDKKNYWCLNFTDPHCKLGWEWLQELSETDDSPAREYFEMDLRLYIETHFYADSKFSLPRLY